jgi:dipeptide/tripeptide permease
VYVQDTISWSLGFALPAAAMASAVLLFLAGSANYRHVAPTESPMARVVKVVAAALKNRCVRLAVSGSRAHMHMLVAMHV